MAILALYLVFLLSGVQAQSNNAESDYTYSISAEDVIYTIGARIIIAKEWSHPKNAQVEEPILTDTFYGFEKVEEGEIKSETVDGIVHNSRAVIYTVFDSGYYTIPGQVWQYANGKTVNSNGLFIQVNHVEVDEEAAIQPIQKPFDMPYTWAEIWPILLIVWLVLGGGGYLLYYFVWAKKHKKQTEPVATKPTIPAPDLALQKLHELKDAQLWQQNKYKAYHSEISVIIREYIENHFDNEALSSTTDEVIFIVKSLGIYNDQLRRLQSVLQLADLVKFAKAVPLPNENEESWKLAIDFVESTKDFFNKPKEETVVESV